MKKPRQTRVRSVTEAFHNNCPKVKVYGAPPPRMTVARLDAYWIVFECPRCRTTVNVFTDRGSSR